MSPLSVLICQLAHRPKLGNIDKYIVAPIANLKRDPTQSHNNLMVAPTKASKNWEESYLDIPDDAREEKELNRAN